MMTEERLRQYKARLEKTARDTHIDRMAAMDKEEYSEMTKLDERFREVVAQISTVSYILSE